MAALLFDRDTVPGPEPDDLLVSEVPALIVPGEDASHTQAAARYLQECLPVNEYWDVSVTAQTAETAPARVMASWSQSPFETCLAVRPIWVSIKDVALSTSRFLIAATNWRCSRMPRIPISGCDCWTWRIESKVGP